MNTRHHEGRLLWIGRGTTCSGSRTQTTSPYFVGMVKHTGKADATTHASQEAGIGKPIPVLFCPVLFREKTNTRGTTQLRISQVDLRFVVDVC